MIISAVHRFLLLSMLLLMSIALHACSGQQNTADKAYEDESAATIYTKALNLFNNDELAEAANSFEEIEKRYPYSPWAKNAQLMAAYIYYTATEYIDGLLLLDRFIDLYPNDEETAYAHYLKAMIYYEQITTADRDQDFTYKALEQFNIIINNYPKSPYVKDAMLKRDLTFNHLAGKEMDVGRFYLKREDYSAAINRFRIVVEQFQQTAHIKEALARLAEIYLHLGIIEEAEKNAAILGYNYPASPWYKHVYQLFTDKGLSTSALDAS